MGFDERLINPNDGPASSDEPRPGDEDLAEAVNETEGIGGIAGLDPAERSTVGGPDDENVEAERQPPED